jgi:hypothetical protein
MQKQMNETEEFMKQWASRDEESRILAEKMRMYLKVADDITCAYCGLRSGDAPHIKYHIDHIWPRRLGGTDDAKNLCDACSPCNHRKRDSVGWVTLDGRKGVSHWNVWDKEKQSWFFKPPHTIGL